MNCFPDEVVRLPIGVDRLRAHRLRSLLFNELRDTQDACARCAAKELVTGSANFAKRHARRSLQAHELQRLCIGLEFHEAEAVP